MSLDPLNLSNLIASFDSISKFEEGDSISIREGNIEIGDPEEESTDWKGIAEKVKELNETARKIIEQSEEDPKKIEHMLKKIEGAKAGLERISKFFRGQSKGDEMEMTEEEDAAHIFKQRAGELGEQHHRLVQLLSPKEKNLADTAFQRLAGPLSGLTPEERVRFKGEELGELDVPRSLQRQKGKGGMAEMQLWGEAVRVDIPRELKVSIERVAKRPEFIIIIGELTKFAKSLRFDPIGENEWQIDLGEDITLEVDTPDMGKANYILSSPVKVRLSDGKIEFLDRSLKFQVQTPKYEQLEDWYKSATWWNFITKKAIKKAVESKKAPTHIDLNVNSIEIKDENVTFNVSVILEKGIGKKLSKLIPELHQSQPVSEFLELIKAVKP